MCSPISIPIQYDFYRHLYHFSSCNTPDISFCPTLKPHYHVLDCSQGTTPIYFVNHFQSLWDWMNNAILSHRLPEEFSNPELFEESASDGTARRCPVPNKTSKNDHESVVIVGRKETASAPRSLPLSHAFPPDALSSTIPSTTQHFCSLLPTSVPRFQIFRRRGCTPNCRFHVVVVNGFPFLVLTTIPRLNLLEGEELVVDKGEKWHQHRRHHEWLLLWNEFVSKRGNTVIIIKRQQLELKETSVEQEKSMQA